MEVSAKKSTAEAVLGVLTRGDKSGYEIRQYLEQSTENFWSESYAQIYAALRELEAEGSVEVLETVKGSKSGHPAKKVYRSTWKGMERLSRWFNLAPRPQAPRNELLLKVFFGDSAAAGEMRKQVEMRRDEARAELVRYEGILVDLETRFGRKVDRGEHPALPFWRMPLNYGIAEARMVLAWCKATLKELKELDDNFGLSKNRG